MRHKLLVSRYGGGRALVCGILGGGSFPMGSVVVGVGGAGVSGWRISWPDRVTCVALEICRIDVLFLVLVLL